MTATMDRARSGRRPGRICAATGAGLQIALAIGIGILRTHNASIGERHAEGFLPTLALVAIVAAPGILAFVGLALDRPLLFGVAAAPCIPIAMISIAAFPVLIPAGLMLTGGIQGMDARPASLTRALLAFTCFVGLLVAALGLFLHEMGTYTYSFANGSEGGDYYLPTNAAFAIMLVGVAITLTAAIATRPVRS